MKRNHVFIIGLTLFLLLAWGCSDGQEEIPGDGGDVKKQEVNLILTSLPLQGSGTVTRSVSRVMDIPMGGESEAETRATDESKIENLCVFQFTGESEGSSTAKLISKNYVSNSSDGTTVPVALVPNVQSFIYVCANVGNITANFSVSNSTYQDILDASLRITGQDVFNTSLPMSGCSELFKIEKTTDDVNIALTRMVAKVTFNCDLSALPNGDTFEITSAKLCNVPQTAKYVSEEKTSTVEVNSYVGIGTLNTAAKTTTYAWYMLENKRGNRTDAKSWTERIEKNAPTGASYIELTGNYTPLGGVVYGATYVIYLGNGTSYTNYDVERNHHYRITSKIKGINLADLRVTTDTNLSADGLANCYLAGKNSHWYRFNGTVRGNGNTEDYAHQQYGGNLYEKASLPSISMMPSKVENAADAVTIPIESVAKAGIVWETAQGIIAEGTVGWDFNTGCVRFKTGFALGNALLAVYDKDDNILWSWHIWRTDGVDLAELNRNHVIKFKTNTTYSWYAGENGTYPGYGRERDLVMMECKIGAHLDKNSSATAYADNLNEYNIVYQFGRKDPMPMSTVYNGSFKKIEVSETPTKLPEILDYVVAYPNQFIRGIESTGYNWMNNATLNSEVWCVSNCLWGDNNPYGGTSDNMAANLDPVPWGVNTSKPKEANGGKTIYDPSPAGWRVTPADTWSAITDGKRWLGRRGGL